MANTQRAPMLDAPSLRDAMNRLFEQSVVRPASALARALTVPMDVYVEGDNYVIEMALPGVPPDDVNMTVEGNQVTVSGEYPTPPEGRQYLLQEQPRGRFERTVTLPTVVDADRAQAQYEHGIVRLILPKAVSARPRRIPIASGSGQHTNTQPAVHTGV